MAARLRRQTGPHELDRPRLASAAAAASEGGGRLNECKTHRKNSWQTGSAARYSDGPLGRAIAGRGDIHTRVRLVVSDRLIQLVPRLISSVHPQSDALIRSALVSHRTRHSPAHNFTRSPPRRFIHFSLRKHRGEPSLHLRRRGASRIGKREESAHLRLQTIHDHSDLCPASLALNSSHSDSIPLQSKAPPLSPLPTPPCLLVIRDKHSAHPWPLG